MILFIDPGTHCGWGLLDAKGQRVASGVWDLKPRRHEGGGMRYLRVRRYVLELLTTYEDQITALGYEEVRRHMSTDAAHVYGGIVGAVAMACEEYEVPYSAIPVGTIKKAATGKGNASKEEMVAAADSRWLIECASDDEADALWGAVALMEQLGMAA